MSLTTTTIKWTLTSAFMLSLGTLWYSGLFTPLKFRLTRYPKSEAKRIRLKGCYRGKYRDAAKFIRQIEKELKADHTVVIFWDDPRIVGETRCRFSVGIVLNEEKNEHDQRWKGWSEVEVDTDLEAIYISLPYTNPLSNIVAAARVYPAWVEECKRLGKGHGPIIKITNKSQSSIEFYFLTMPPPPSFAKSMDHVNE